MLILLLPPSITTSPMVSAPLPWLDRTVLAMGTELRLHLEGAGDLGRASEGVLAESARIERACSTWDPTSVWSRLNASEGAQVVLGAEWINLLGRVKDWSLRTEGAFDPVLMALMQAWRIRQGGRVPAPGTLAKARMASGQSLLVLDQREGTARLLHPQAVVEEGGFLKGYALDAMRAVSRVSSGWLDFGGQVLAWGRPFKVDVADPRDRRRPVCSLFLEEGSLSCSGTSERGRHLLDPRSGRPCPAWGGTAVVAPDGLSADVLSTALYVLGPAEGLLWAERHGVAAAFFLNDGSLRMTSRFQRLNPEMSPGVFQ